MNNPSKKDNEKPEDWREELDEMGELIHYRFRSSSYWERTMKEVEDFIEQVHKQAYEDGKKEILEKLKEIAVWPEPNKDAGQGGPEPLFTGET